MQNTGYTLTDESWFQRQINDPLSLANDLMNNRSRLMRLLVRRLFRHLLSRIPRTSQRFSHKLLLNVATNHRLQRKFDVLLSRVFRKKMRPNRGWSPY